MPVDVAEMQLRFIYSLFKPVARAAARFRVPIRTLVELMRLAYYEHLARTGLSTTEIAECFGQTPRHMQSLARKIKSDFFTAERAGGLVREVEAFVAAAMPTTEQVLAEFPTWDHRDVTAAIDLLLTENRVEKTDDGHLQTARPYVVMRTDQFHHRIDSLNHYLDGSYRAVLHRLVFDNKRTAMMKTISFSALGEELELLLQKLEGELRRELGALDESATFQGRADERYTICLSSAPVDEEVTNES